MFLFVSIQTTAQGRDLDADLGIGHASQQETEASDNDEGISFGGVPDSGSQANDLGFSNSEDLGFHDSDGNEITGDHSANNQNPSNLSQGTSGDSSDPGYDSSQSYGGLSQGSNTTGDDSNNVNGSWGSQQHSPSNPWDGLWSDSFGGFASEYERNPGEMNQHEQAIQTAIETANQNCSNCSAEQRAVVLNTSYYSDLANQNSSLPQGPLETMETFGDSASILGSPEDTAIRNRRVNQVDSRVRNGDLGVIMPGQVSGLGLYDDVVDDTITRFGLESAPIVIGPKSTLSQAFDIPPEAADNFDHGYHDKIAGSGGTIAIISNRCSGGPCSSADSVPSLDPDNMTKQQEATLRHEARHAASFHAAVVTDRHLGLDGQASDSYRSLSSSEQESIETAQEMLWNEVMGETISADDCNSCGIVTGRDVGAGIDQITEIVAARAEGELGVGEYANEIQRIDPSLSRNEALEAARDILDSPTAVELDRATRQVIQVIEKNNL